MTVVLFEDRWVRQLYPVTVGRPAFTIGCGASRLIEQVRTLGEPVVALVRAHLKASLETGREGTFEAVESDACDRPLRVALEKGNRPTLFVNARLVPSVRVRLELARLLAAGQPGIVTAGEQVVAALLEPGRIVPQPLDLASLPDWLLKLGLAKLDAKLPVIQYPHEIIRHHLSSMQENLERRLAEGNYQEIADGVFIAEGAMLGAHVVTNTKKGLIVLESQASVGPHAYLQGPVHVGAGARVIEHAAIKDCVALGHTTKAGGEIEASIIEPYTNKQHYGFLGHSLVGSWINLGAGTCNSDLKNTYGQVNMQYGDRKISTEMQFVGTFIGDYTKTAINTGIFTGKTIGVCSMAYGFVTTNVPSFVNYARSFGQVTAAPVEVMITTQARMFARRGVTQLPTDIQLLRDMHELTRHERELGEAGSITSEPLSW